MKRFGWVFVAITLVSAGCSPQELPEKENAGTAAGPTWKAIPGTEDRILVLVTKIPIREAVVDVKWSDEARSQAMAGGFKRAAEAVNTRAVYRFNCKTLQMQMQSYSVLSARGETLTSEVENAPKPSPVSPGSTGAFYLAAACGDAIGPKIRQRLQVN
jgi:hypothetical protein